MWFPLRRCLDSQALSSPDRDCVPLGLAFPTRSGDYSVMWNSAQLSSLEHGAPPRAYFHSPHSCISGSSPRESLEMGPGSEGGKEGTE